MNYTEIVKKLIGKINPIGETNTDAERFENLKEVCKLIDELHIEIDDIAYRNKDSKKFSVKRSVDYINQFLDNLGIKE
jgi:hypothetical protein